MKKRGCIRAIAISVLSVLASTLLWAGAASAQATLTQGYQSDQTLQKGMIVRLKPSDGSKVEALTEANEASMLGVVVAGSDAPVSLSNSTNTQQVYVANDGQFSVLVSNQNGGIKVGDYIGISSLTGVGMKATDKQKVILGKALGAFDGTTNVESSATLHGSFGSKQVVSLGRVQVELSVGRNPLFATPSVAGVPSALSRAARLVTTQPVGAIRIYAALGILAVTIVIAGVILYAGVRTALTAIGRNPLAKRSIVRSLLTVIVMSLMIFVVGLTAIYLILRL